MAWTFRFARGEAPWQNDRRGKVLVNRPLYHIHLGGTQND